MSTKLLEISQNVVDTSSCDSSYGGGNNIKSSMHLCAVTSNAGSCNGGA